jgi:hypothetical protein
MRTLLFLSIIVFCTAASAAPPQKLTLQYDMSRNGTALAEVVETLEHDGKTYNISSETRGKGLYALLGVLKRSSRGTVTPHGLRPLEFRDQRGARPATIARFDWAKHSLTQERDGKSESLDLPASAQDTLSMIYSFSFSPPSGKEVLVTRADGRGLAEFRFTVAGAETLTTPVGEMQTVHLSKQKDGPDDKSTDVWFASGKNFLPVRVLVVDKDGTRMDQMLTHLPE